MKLALTYLSSITGVLMAISTQAADLPELKTVPSVDISRYQGLWHQIAFYPTRFQKKCTVDTTARYTLTPDGKVGVVNECTSDSGKRKSISGTARVVDEATNAKLKVKFFWFAPAGDYWIIDLGANYEYAVVGAPNRKYLWILSRTPSLDSATYEKILDRAVEQGFSREKIQITGKVTQ